MAAAAYDFGFVPEPELDDLVLQMDGREDVGPPADFGAHRLLRHSLIAQPRLSVLSREGRVTAHISHIDESDAIDLLTEVENRFIAATLNRGAWTWTLNHQQPSIELATLPRRYRIGRLELPVPASSEVTQADLTAGITAAVSAARLTWEHDAPIPAGALRSALSDPLRAQWIAGRLHQREATADPAVDIQICTGVEIELGADIDGPVFLGRATGFGNGLLVSTHHR